MIYLCISMKKDLSNPEDIHKPELDKPNKPVLNVPAADLPITPLTIDEIEEAAKKRISRIDKEFAEGFALIKNQPKSVSFFGSSRFSEGNIHYGQARRLAARFAKLGFSVLSGGG